MKGKVLSLILCLLALLPLSGCFTGVESTKAITQKDVERAYAGSDDAGEMSIEIALDTFPRWASGKRFYVTDNNIRHIFTPSAQFVADTLALQGRTITYDNYTLALAIDGRHTVTLHFQYGNTQLQYNTGRTMEEIERTQSRLEVPFLVDLDEVARIRQQLVGLTFYIRTPIWYDRQGDMTSGRKYVPVAITDVLPGDKVFPLLVEFDDNGRRAYVFMSYGDSYLHRAFDDLFSTTDLRRRYPAISDDNWQRIIAGTVAANMTKEECRLAIGAPNTLERVPTYSGVREYWYYSNGTYLIFDEEGLLTTFRR